MGLTAVGAEAADAVAVPSRLGRGEADREASSDREGGLLGAGGALLDRAAELEGDPTSSELSALLLPAGFALLEPAAPAVLLPDTDASKEGGGRPVPTEDSPAELEELAEAEALAGAQL